MSASEACEPALRTLIPSLTKAGVLGITRTTAMPGGNAASNALVRTPAAIEMINVSGERCGASCSHTCMST